MHLGGQHSRQQDDDEHETLIEIGPSVRSGVRLSTRLNDYSLLRTTEDMLRVGHLGAASSATSMRGRFHL
jgi:hypothetical protein